MINSIFGAIPVLAIIAWLIYFKLEKSKSKAKQHITFILSVALIGFFILWYYLRNYYNFSTALDTIWVFTSLSVYPLYYYYLRLMTVEIKIDYKWIWLCIPAFTLAISTAIIYSMMTPQEIEIFTNRVMYTNSSIIGGYSTLIRLQYYRIKLFELTLIIEVLLTLYFGMRHIIRSNKKVFIFYSKVKARNIPDISVPFLFLITSTILAMTSNIIGQKFYFNNPYLLTLPFIEHTIAYCIACCDKYKKRIIVKGSSINGINAAGEELKEEEEDSEVDIFILDNKYDDLYEKMEHLLKNKQIFRNPELRLNDLVLKLGSNRTYVSQLINNKTSSSFNDYINLHRIEYAKDILISTEMEHMTLDEVAFKSGFSSQSSFYRIFMKMEETSPAKYRLKHNEKSDQIS